MPPGKHLIPDDDRPRGILTEADRSFLKGKKEFSSEQSERDARYRIRQRIKNSILDFSIITRYLDSKDRDQIFKPLAQKSGNSLEEFQETLNSEAFNQFVEDTMLINGVSDTFGFFYKATKSADVSFEEMLESTIEDIESDDGYVVEEVNVSIEIERKQPDIQELKSKMEQGEALSSNEIATLVRSGALDLSSENMDDVFRHLAESLMEERGNDDLPGELLEDDN